MKKLICMLMALVLSVSLAVPAFAADTFVPSITYKDGPEVGGSTVKGDDTLKVEEDQLTGMLVVTSISEAQEKSTPITQPERDLLLDLYTQMDSGDMKLPVANDQLVVRELVDVSYASIGAATGQAVEAWLEKEGNTVTVEFDLGVADDTEVIVMIFAEEEWVPAEKVVNLGNGKVSVEFQRLGSVAFCVDADTLTVTPTTEPTEDPADNQADGGNFRVLLLGAIAAGSLGMLLILLIIFKRSKDEEEEQSVKK